MIVFNLEDLLCQLFSLYSKLATLPISELGVGKNINQSMFFNINLPNSISI